jgi:metal-dependent amidase/aminoacylase/carboxypeptidase family protein
VPQATITINTVASNMSMFSIPKLSKDLIQRNIMNDMMFSICHAPAKFDPTVLTTENKQQITKDFDELLTWLNNEKNIANDPQRKSFLLTFIDRCEGLVSYMNSTDNSDLLDTAKQALAMQDKFRNTDYTKILRL